VSSSENVQEALRPVGFEFGLVAFFALTGAGALAVLTSSWTTWKAPELAAIAVLTVVSDLTSVEATVGKIRVSGMLIGLALAAALLGGCAAAAVGELVVIIGWIRWREPLAAFVVNVVDYAWFPLLMGVVFNGAIRLFHVGHATPSYYLLVLPMFVIGLLVNWVGIAVYECYRRGGSVRSKVHEVVVPILAAELFSAVLTTAALYFIIQTGTVGIAIVAAVLAIFQYLIGELLKSKQRAEELRRKATTDELTGLANREHFSAVVADRIAHAQAAGDSFAVMLLDLDHFKEINDTLGHHYGDVLLSDLGPRLAKSVGAGGIVARLGGDEFAILHADGNHDVERLEGLAREVLEAVSQPVPVDDLRLDVGASIGIARYPEDGEDVHALLRRADVAMYSAKEDRSSYKLYAAELDRHSVRRLTVLSDFRRALDANEFVLYYQPVVDVEARRTRSAESLVRWEHPEMGLIPPGDFIPIAEQSGLIGPLTRYVLERAAAECASWRAAGRDLSVAVNLSVRDLLDHDLPTLVSRILASYHLPGDALHLEITESMIMSDPERALATVTKLRELGVKISVDDFGTGYSSLANLKQLPINELKIDRTFISSMLQDASDLIIVRSTINLGHDLRLKVVAEGVEDDLTLRQLANLGCDLAQGYHLSRPLPSKDFVEWVEQADRMKLVPPEIAPVPPEIEAAPAALQAPAG
jgi:diguanylate cyclase (GGDEF)-like protein